MTDVFSTPDSILDEAPWSVTLGVRGCGLRLYEDHVGSNIYCEEHDGGRTSTWSLRHKNRSRALQWGHGEVCRLLRKEGQHLLDLADRCELLMQVEGVFPDA